MFDVFSCITPFIIFFNSDKLEIITDKNIPIVHLFHSFLFGFFIFNFLFFGRDRRYVLR